MVHLPTTFDQSENIRCRPSKWIEPRWLRVILGLEQLLRPLGVADVPVELAFAFRAIPEIDGPDQDTTGKVVAVHVVDPVFRHHLGLFLLRVPPKARVDVDSTPNLGRAGAELDGLCATHDRFGVRLTDGQGFQPLDGDGSMRTRGLLLPIADPGKVIAP